MKKTHRYTSQHKTLSAMERWRDLKPHTDNPHNTDNWKYQCWDFEFGIANFDISDKSLSFSIISLY